MKDQSIAKWPDQWDSTTKGLATKQCFPNIKDRLTKKNKLTPNFTAIVSAHGKTKAYLHRFNPYPTAFPYGNGMVLHFYQQQESSTTKTVHKVINKGLKTYV